MTNINSIKTLNFIPNSKQKESDLKRMHSLFQFDISNYLKDPLIDRFISEVPTSLNFVICPPNKSAFNYFQRTLEIGTPSDQIEYIISSFKFSDEPSIGTDRHVYALPVEVSRFKTLFHEGCHAKCEGIQYVFSILNDRKSDKIDTLNPTLDAAMHMFTKNLEKNREFIEHYCLNSRD